MDELVRHGWHWSFGWLRRPELDAHSMYCYETPDGDQIFCRGRYRVYLDCRKDEDTQELYVCLAPYSRRGARNRRTNQ